MGLEVVSFPVDPAVRVGRPKLETGRFTDLGAQEAQDGVADGQTVMGRTSRDLRVRIALWLAPDSFSDPGGFSRIDEAFENLIKSSHYSILVLKSLKDGHTNLAGATCTSCWITSAPTTARLRSVAAYGASGTTCSTEYTRASRTYGAGVSPASASAAVR